MSLKGKSALVTGAAQGIGRACAERLAHDGCKVMLSDVNADKGNVAKLAAVDKKIVEAARDVAVAVANLGGLNVKSFKKLTFGHPIL